MASLLSKALGFALTEAGKNSDFILKIEQKSILSNQWERRLFQGSPELFFPSVVREREELLRFVKNRLQGSKAHASVLKRVAHAYNSVT